MIYINVKTLKPLKKWLDKSEELLAELKKYENDKKKRDELIDKSSSQNHWKSLKPLLRKLSFNKCWYSEAREIYSHYHVEHFRPKKKAVDDISGKKEYRDGYWWLTFDYKNYRLCGSVGNSTKSNHFAVKKNCATCPDDDIDDEIIYFLDPTKRSDPKKIKVNELGEMKPSNPNEKHWDHIRAKYTIKYFDLNFPDLKQGRHIKWTIVHNMILEIENLDIEYQESPSAKKEERLENKIEEVRKMLAPCEELSSTVRACLKYSKRDWAIALLEENIVKEDIEKYCAPYLKELNNDDK